MPIISIEVMKTIDEGELQKTTKEKQTKAEEKKEARRKEAIVKGWELNNFAVHLS